MKIPDVLGKRRASTQARLQELTDELERTGAKEIAEKEGACIYATGSGGRGEMSTRSDLDVFIVKHDAASGPLRNLEEIRLKARLIEASRKLRFDDFSGDGKYVRSYDVRSDLIEKLGTSRDDYENVFTARLLLLLESKPILNPALYDQAIGALVLNYWRDYEQNSAHFLPVFLMNDILRFWKTLCLNYEERTGSKVSPEEDLAKARGKRRLHNYKLKYSRMLTCYSAIIYLMATLKRDNGTVDPEVALDMVKESPTRRLELVAEIEPRAIEHVESILSNYAQFLEVCDDEKSVLELKFSESNFKNSRFDEAKDFGRSISNLLNVLGEGSDLIRYLLV